MPLLTLPLLTVDVFWIEAAIKESDGLIAVISEKYMHSTYCNNGILMRTAVCNSSSELFAEMVMAQSSGLQLFPILFRETTFESLPEGKLDSCFQG